MDGASAVVGPVVNVLTVIKQKLRNLTSYAEHVERMRNRMQVLEDQSADIERLKRQHPTMPAHVPGWLEDVKKIKEDVDNIPSNTIGCFNVKKKFLAGRNALRLTKVIEGVIREGSDMISDDTIWREAEGYLGRVDSKNPASTSTSGVSVFNSRVKTFNYALKLLRQDDDGAARVIALCGMGGVGKTTLMMQLKEAARDYKMFRWIVVVVIGNTPNLLAIQKVIAAHTGKPLNETDETLMATYLSKRFEEFSGRKERCLVILDDVWDWINLKDIGLASPLPKGVKLLLTSREESICHQIAVVAKSVLKLVRVDVLEEEEARDLFCQIAEISAEHDRDLYDIGCKIVKKCGCLPLAINIIAADFKCEKKRSVWKHKLKSLKKNNNVLNIVDMSYKNLEREDKAIFLLCGLFPEDSNIPIEDLTRYAWGLKLLKQVYTMEAARDSIKTSVSNLKNAYLLMNGDNHHSDSVKLHDVVLAFVVNTVSKGGEEGCWIIHHEDDFSNWSGANDMSQSCKQISLICKGVSEFPSEFKFPNLTVLKLMYGNESLTFPQDFYEGMEKLQVIAFEKLKYPLVPTSLQCSANLRTLCLDKCSLMFDLAFIGCLSNLEVLSFANSGVTILPPTFGNLKKLRLLDVTGCYKLVIDDGVLKSLVKLEELYMRTFDDGYYHLDGCAFCFTDNNTSELAECSKNLRALEFEFIGDNANMKNMSYKKLQRFKLSLGCSFTEVRLLHRPQGETRSYQNSLKLITNREELLKSKINELFKITDALYLQVEGMNTLEDVDVESPNRRHLPRYSSFYNLRLLVVSQCAELKYLFMSVATNLSKLEYLDISGCPNMEAVIHAQNDGLDRIKFSNLKYLRLAELPKLLHFCNNVAVIELPRLMELQLEGLPKFTSIYPDSATSFASRNISPTQSFLNKEDATPKLEKLFVKDCDSIEVLFNMDFPEIEQFSSGLRSVKVDGCNSLKKLFSCNPFPFFNNLQELDVRRCRSIKVLFEIDSGRAGRFKKQYATPKLDKLFVKDCHSIEVLFYMDFGEIEHLSSGLRSIKVDGCNSLVKLFSCNPFPFFNNLQELDVRRCRSIQVLFEIDSGRTGNIGEQVCTSSLRSIVVWGCDSLVNLFPRNPMPLFNHLEELRVTQCASIEVIFNIDMRCVGETDKVSSSRLRSIRLWGLETLREVWRIKNAGNDLIHGFEAIERIEIRACERFEKLITPATANFGMRVLERRCLWPSTLVTCIYGRSP